MTKQQIDAFLGKKGDKKHGDVLLFVVLVTFAVFLCFGIVFYHLCKL
jgi:hypothetical protein